MTKTAFNLAPNNPNFQTTPKSRSIKDLETGKSSLKEQDMDSVAIEKDPCPNHDFITSSTVSFKNVEMVVGMLFPSE
ncbi:hypothetical protein TNCV_389741 [Trichonephila clavipes]|nr:hypothetical protein TNCV_389741 [Trichonephila clavipes]